MVKWVTQRLLSQLVAAEQRRDDHRAAAFEAVGVRSPQAVPEHEMSPSGTPMFKINMEMTRAMSELVSRANLTLVDAIRAWRGQSSHDPQANKALQPAHCAWLLHGYEQLERLLSVSSKGVQHTFTSCTVRQPLQPPRENHKSAREMFNALCRSIREGQDNGTYLVVESKAAERWIDIHYSPFGCVPKGDSDVNLEARVIHDLSFPHGASTNAWSDQSDLPALSYESVDAIARRIVDLRAHEPTATIKIMKGDVKAAFRHIHVHEATSAYFAGVIPEADVAVIDLALPFGWTGLPAHYGVFGGAISYLVRRESPHSLDPCDNDTERFFCFDWVDDHVLAEIDTGNRLRAADIALRLAMIAVLGPRAINEKKFTGWATKIIALGLEWDTIAMTVSMPEVKIHKALRRVSEMMTATRTTRLALSKLLGSLRHVCSCIRPAKPFFQRLASLWRQSPRAGTIVVSADAKLDLLWFEFILQHGRLRGIPLELFYSLPDPAIHLYMDASNEGLCVLHPARKEFLRVKFDSDEQQMIRRGQLSINVREQLSATLAVLCWGPGWGSRLTNEHLHIRFWIDNSSAVSWCNRLHSTNPHSQEMNRLLGAAEAEWGIRVSAEHLAGSSNFLADLGGRAEAFQDDLQGRLVALQQRSLADTSRRQYAVTWRQWVDFSKRLGRSPWLPREDTAAQSLQLVLFAIHRWSLSAGTGRHGPVATIQAKVSHVKWYHRVYAGFSPEINAGHYAALTGMRRLTTGSAPKAPTTTAMLKWIAANSNLHQPRHRLILGAAVLGYFFLLRSSEYLAVKGGRHRYALEVKDVEVLDTIGQPAQTLRSAVSVRITLRGSKTDQNGQGTQRRLNRSGHKHVCPVVGAAMLLELAARHDLRPTDPICSVDRSRMLQATEISSLLKRAAAATGADPKLYSSHSLRSGGSTALIAAGADSTSIKLHGRWRSDVYQRYTRYTDAVGSHFAAMMAGTGTEHNTLTETPRRWGSRPHRGVPTRRLDLSN